MGSPLYRWCTLMSMGNEMSITEIRAELPDVVTRAEGGEVTFITRHGHRVAAIVSLNLIKNDLATAEREAWRDDLINQVMTENAGLFQRLADA
jgi:prevent-host-death family protein